jgi:hypothetical protein
MNAALDRYLLEVESLMEDLHEIRANATRPPVSRSALSTITRGMRSALTKLGRALADAQAHAYAPELVIESLRRALNQAKKATHALEVAHLQLCRALEHDVPPDDTTTATRPIE